MQLLLALLTIESFLLTWQAPKSTRKRNTPENAGNRPFQESAFSGVLRFRVCFGAQHPKTQHTRKRRFWKRSITCIFGCVAFPKGPKIEKIQSRLKISISLEHFNLD